MPIITAGAGGAAASGGVTVTILPPAIEGKI